MADLQRRKAAAAPKEIVEAPAVKGISRSRAPRQPLEERMTVKLKQGSTRIQQGSARDRVIKLLEKNKGSMTVGALAKRFELEALKGVISKLREAGWVEVQ